MFVLLAACVVEVGLLAVARSPTDEVVEFRSYTGCRHVYEILWVVPPKMLISKSLSR